MKLNELLKECVGRKILSFQIDNNKIIPYDELELMLIEGNVEGGYYVTTLTNITICLIYLRDSKGEWKHYDFTVSYTNDEKIRSLNFDNYKIYFKS
jgi:hypothetical protein